MMKEKLKFLVIDTSDENLTSVTFYNSGKVYLKNSTEERGHIKNLMPLIRDVLFENSISISDLDFIAVVEGPGSWTGLRIGFATVKVLCLINNLKLIVINNFDVFQKNFENKNNSTEIVILINSSNLNYYYRYILKGSGEYADGIGSIKTLEEKFPKIEKINFIRPNLNEYINLAIEKFEHKRFQNVDSAEPYYISTGDIKSNFTKAKV